MVNGFLQGGLSSQRLGGVSGLKRRVLIKQGLTSDVGAAAGFLWIVGQVGLFWVRLHPIGLGSIGLRHVTFCSAGQATTSTTSKPGGQLKLRRGEPRPLQRRTRTTDMIPVRLDGNRIVADHGLTLVDNVDEFAFVNELESIDGGLVLGFRGRHGTPTHMEDIALGQLRCERFLASARCKLWWMTPEWGKKVKDLPPETQFMLVELQESGPYAIILPLIDGNSFRATLRPPKFHHFGSQNLIVRMESGCDDVVGSIWNSGLYIAAGWDPFVLVEQGVSAAGRISGGSKPRRDKKLPESLDVFGWCTWDAFYSTVSAKGVAEGLKSLCDGGTPPKLLIIDDGWQKTENDPPKNGASVGKQETAKKTKSKENYLGESEGLITDASYVPPSISDTVTPTEDEAGSTGKVVEIEDDDDYDMLDDEDAVSMNVLQKIFAWFFGLFQGFMIFLYQGLIDKAPPDSARVKMFTALANGPLRNLMVGFFAAGGDFSRRLTDVKANGKFSSPSAGHNKKWKEKEENLSHVVSYLKEEFGVRYIYCWHGLPAYWSGVMPEGPGVAKYNAKIVYAKPPLGLLEIEPSLAWNPAVLCGMGVVDTVEDLYNDMHEYLMASGVTGVKVDCQAGVGLIGSVLGGGAAVAYAMHSALEKSAEKHFPGNHVINCMCHSTENIYRMVNTAVARASDDFYPRDPSSTTPHIAASAFNSVFLAPLVHPDWDMFQSKHPGARLHAMARAVSGAAIYVSDKPGNHDFDLLKELVLPDGSVFRAQLPGRPTRDCLFRNVLKDSKTLLKVWNMNKYSGIVGLFNLQGSSWDRTIRKFHTHNGMPPRLETLVSPRDVENFVPLCKEMRNFSGQYVAYVYEPKAMHVGGEDLCVSVGLEAQKSEIVSFSPVLRLGEILFAPVGLLNMMNGTGGVISCSGANKSMGITVEKGKKGKSKETSIGVHRLSGKSTVFTTEVRGCGTLLCYTSREPVDMWIGSQSVGFEYDLFTGALKAQLPRTESMLLSVQVVF